MQLLKMNYRHLLKHVGKPEEKNFIDASTANTILSDFLYEPSKYVVSYDSVGAFLEEVHCTMFVMFQLKRNNGYIERVPTELVLLDFDDDTSWEQHEKRILSLKEELGISVNGYYKTHSWSEHKWKLRYVIRFDEAPTLEEYKDMMLYFATKYGMDKNTTGFGRRIYGSGEERGYLLTEEINSLSSFITKVTNSVKMFKDKAKAEEEIRLSKIEQSADDFNDLPIVQEFLTCKEPLDLYRWAEKWSLTYECDGRGRYTTFFQTVYNYAVYLGNDEYTDSLVAHYKRLGGKQISKFGKRNRYSLGKAKYYKFFSWKLFNRQLAKMNDTTNGLIDFIGVPKKVKKYLSVSEVSKFLHNRPNKNQGMLKKLLVSTAGTGKTYCITKALMESKSSFVFLMPTTAITGNQETKYLEMYLSTDEGYDIYSKAINGGIDDNMESIINYIKMNGVELSYGFFHGNNPIKETTEIDSFKYVFCTYDQFVNLLRFSDKFNVRDFLIIDEAHLLGQYQGISSSKMEKLRTISNDAETSHRFKQLVHCTATPFNLPDVYDDKLAFVAECKKQVSLCYCDERLGATKLESNIYYPSLLKQTFNTLNIDLSKKPKILIFIPTKKEEIATYDTDTKTLKNGELTSLLGKTIGYDDSEITGIHSGIKTESDEYKYLVYGVGESETKVVVSTSILNTGVDIKNEFDYIVCLGINDLNFLLQSLHRDRSDNTRIIFAMQQKTFVERTWSEEEQDMVPVVPKKKTEISKHQYGNFSWMSERNNQYVKQYSSSTVSELEGRQRQALVDYIIHTVKFKTTSMNSETFINDPFYGQYVFYQNYVGRCVSPKIISNCLNELSVSHDFTYVPDVKFNDSTSSKIDEMKVETESEELLISSLNGEMLGITIGEYRYKHCASLTDKKEMNELKSRGLIIRQHENNKFLNHVLPEYTSDKLFKLMKRICKDLAYNKQLTNYSYSDIGQVLFDVVSDLGYVVLDVPVEVVYLLVHEKITGNKSYVRYIIEQNINRDMTVAEYKMIVTAVKSCITAVQSNRITSKYVVRFIEGLGFSVTKSVKRDVKYRILALQ